MRMSHSNRNGVEREMKLRKLSFDAQLLLKPCLTGIGRYAENILKNLEQKKYVLELNVFVGKREKPFLSILEEYKKQGYKVRKSFAFSGVVYKVITSIFPLPYYMFFGRDSDVTVFFNYIIPPGVKGKKIVFIHDMAYKVYPETLRTRTKIWLNLKIQHSIRRADKVITISEFSKREIVKYLKIHPDDIEVIYAGVDFNVYHPNYAIKKIERIKQKYQIREDYFMYLGTLEPRKNIVGLVKAYGKLKKRLFGKQPKLVLAGKKGWLYKEIYVWIERLQLKEDIIFVGYITEEESALLMNGAIAFVFPSFYEGFGLPPLEAMACGTPVIASKAASIPEVVKDAGLLIDPASEEELCDAMLTLVQGNELVKSLRERGIQRAKSFTWENSSKCLRKVMESMF